MNELIVRAAEQLGYEAARIWPQIVMITFVQSLFWLVVDPLFWLMYVVLGLKIFGAWKQFKVRHDENEFSDRGDFILGSVAVWALFVVLGLLVMSATLPYYPSYVSGVLYPEATTVMNMARGLK
jgi:hypothetical protein